MILSYDDREKEMTALVLHGKGLWQTSHFYDVDSVTELSNIVLSNRWRSWPSDHSFKYTFVNSLIYKYV